MTKKRKSNKPSLKPAETAIKQQIIQQQITGPIPAPALMQGYEDILPGSAERILSMAEKDSQHLRDIEINSLNAQKTDIKRSQLLAFLVIALFMGVTVIALYLNHAWIAGIISGTTIVSVVGAFLKTHRR